MQTIAILGIRGTTDRETDGRWDRRLRRCTATLRSRSSTAFIRRTLVILAGIGIYLIAQIAALLFLVRLVDVWFG